MPNRTAAQLSRDVVCQQLINAGYVKKAPQHFMPRDRILIARNLAMATATAMHFHAAAHSAAVHHMTAAAKATIVAVMLASPAEAEDDARTVAIIGVAAVTATVPITTVAMAIAAVVDRLC